MRNIPFSPPDVGQEELEEISKALTSGWITTGPRTKELEKRIAEYCNTDKAVCLNSATACLEGVLRILGIGPGDEVITSAYTYTASASPVLHVGAKLVLLDTQKDSFEMDYDAVASAISEKTKAIIPVDIGGVMCDYEKIFDIVESKKALFNPTNELQKTIGRVAVIADSAHGFGAKRKINGQWKMSGEVADFTTFSFHAVKNFTTAEGGALTWNNIDDIDNNALYKEFMLYSLHGQSKDALAKTQLGAWEYDIVYPAYKCNMTDVAAAMGLVQMDRYETMLNRRRDIIVRYDKAMDELGVSHLCHYDENYCSSGHLYLIRIPDINVEKRNEIITRLAEQGVATNVHYKPLPMMTAYKNLGFDIKDYPNAYAQFENEISLPLNTKLGDEDVKYVIKSILEIKKHLYE